jgi:eukaryotic-like serine/threonine-protein kinase
MAYPEAEDYIRAVQQPERSFLKPGLRTAVFEVHPVFRIPMPASGNAAVVFKARVEGYDTALRFYIREDASSRERYAALGRHFAERRIEDCVAHPTWVDGAISLNDASWPMVRMTWVDGRTLEAYVGHLASTGNTSALASLAAAWRGLVARLQDAEFAHGDLQHGNVLVDTSSSLRLVDFDGSWIGAFSGGPPPHETGHPNYQRTGREWGRWMDTFPGLVIYTALLTLSRRPASWEQLHNGENMLFSAEDFTPPFQTRTWKTVAGVQDAEVEQVAERLKQACTSGWRAGDTLESLLTRPRIEGRQSPTTDEVLPYPGGPVPSYPMDWWQRTGAAAPGPEAVGAAAGRASGAPPAPPARGPMPPPPPKMGPGASDTGGTSPDAPSFARTAPGRTWYSGASGPASRRPPHAPDRPPAGHRPPVVKVLPVFLLVFGLTAVITGSVGAAVVSALIATALMVFLLPRRKT